MSRKRGFSTLNWQPGSNEGSAPRTRGGSRAARIAPSRPLRSRPVLIHQRRATMCQRHTHWRGSHWRTGAVLPLQSRAFPAINDPHFCTVRSPPPRPSRRASSRRSRNYPPIRPLAPDNDAFPSVEVLTIAKVNKRSHIEARAVEIPLYRPQIVHPHKPHLTPPCWRASSQQ